MTSYMIIANCVITYYIRIQIKYHIKLANINCIIYVYVIYPHVYISYTYIE